VPGVFLRRTRKRRLLRVKLFEPESKRGTAIPASGELRPAWFHPGRLTVLQWSPAYARGRALPPP
jgi:hypothetical protein